MAVTTPLIKIAVIGGGLAGAVVAHALIKHPHLDVHVFESAPEFSERGAAVGLAENAQRALEQIVGDAEGRAILDKAGAVVQASSRMCIVSSLNLFRFFTPTCTPYFISDDAIHQGFRAERRDCVPGSAQRPEGRWARRASRRAPPRAPRAPSGRPAAREQGFEQYHSNKACR